MGYLYIILNVVMLVLVLILIFDIFKKVYQSENKFVSFKNSAKYVIIGFLIIFIPVLIMNNYVGEIPLDTEYEKIDFNKKYKKYLALHRNYYNLMFLDRNRLNLNLNYDYLNSLLLYIEEVEEDDEFDYDAFLKTSQHKNVVEIYEKLFKGDNKDIPNLFQGLHYLNLKDTETAKSYLLKVKNDSLHYYNFILGKYYFQTRNYVKAEEYLTKATTEEYIEIDALNELATLNYYFRKEDKLKELVLDNERSSKLKSFFKRIVYFRNLDFKNYWITIFKAELERISFIGFGSALLILMIWLFYLRKVDIYEPESWLHTLIVLFLSMLTIFLVYPLHDILRDVFEYYSSRRSLFDFFHMFVNIGMVEELVKLIPVLIILKFTNAINEPFDYIYYFSISALGFAFVENLGYLEESSLYNINARALMASVAHIVFSSTIGYGMMLAKYKEHKRPLITLILFFILGSLMHAFYDFWLINNWAKQYSWLTTIFFIISIHIWHVYVNNTLNISTFFSDKISIENDKLKYYVILSLVFIVMISWLVGGFTQGKAYANRFILQSIVFYGFFVFYLAFSLSRFEIIRGFLKPFSIPFRLLIPKVSNTEDFTKTLIEIRPSSIYVKEKFNEFQNILPVFGILTKRVVIDDNLECYLVLLDETHSIKGFLNDLVLIFPKSNTKKLNSKEKILVQVLLISSVETLDKHILTKEDFTLLGFAISQKRNV